MILEKYSTKMRFIKIIVLEIYVEGDLSILGQIPNRT